MSYDDSRLDDLAHEHSVIRGVSAQVALALGRGDTAAARGRFPEFAAALRQHLEAEELTVLAALEAVPEFAATVAHLKQEHDEMRAALAEAEAAADEPGWARVVGGLLHEFALHETEEEEDVFRAAEVALPLPASGG